MIPATFDDHIGHASQRSSTPEPEVTGTAEWEAYVSDVRVGLGSRSAYAFLWVQESDKRIQHVMDGGFVVEPTFGTGLTISADGAIHDWIGAVYLPGVGPAEIFASFNQTDNVSPRHGPAMMKTELLSRDGNKIRFAATSEKKRVLSGYTIRANYESIYSWPAPDRWWSMSSSMRMQRFAYDNPLKARRQPAEIQTGYIRRISCVTRAMETERGSIIEVRAIVLGRRVPKSIAWLVIPIVRRICRNALLTTLRQTKDVLTA